MIIFLELDPTVPNRFIARLRDGSKDKGKYCFWSGAGVPQKDRIIKALSEGFNMPDVHINDMTVINLGMVVAQITTEQPSTSKTKEDTGHWLIVAESAAGRSRYATIATPSQINRVLEIMERKNPSIEFKGEFMGYLNVDYSGKVTVMDTSHFLECNGG